MADLAELRTALERKHGQREQLRRQMREADQRVKELERAAHWTEQAQVIIQTVAKRTQDEIRFHISDLVSLALGAIFDDPYTLDLEFVIKRGKTEAEINFQRDGQRVPPLYGSGGGPVDVAAFALRVALWSLGNPKTRNIILLDEPFRFLSRDLQPKASLLLKQLSERLDLQFTMISHSPDLIEGADRVFEFRTERGQTLIEVQ